MGNSVFPTSSTLPGLTWNQTKTPIFQTRIQRAISGRELRAAFFVYPLYEWTLSYELLRDSNGHNEIKTLMGFYLSRQGALDDFLYIDPTDSNANNQAIAVGDGNNANFQMVRTYGGWVDPVYDIQASPAPVVYLNGNAANNTTYSITLLGSGILHFNSAPANGVVISSTFSYYQRVRFIEYDDGSDAFSQFMYNLWEAKKVSFVTAR